MEANLQGAELEGADFRGANMTHVNLHRAIARRINVQGVSLPFADLSGAYLEYSNLQETWLSFVNLQGAELDNANLQGARRLSESGWQMDEETCLPDGQSWKPDTDLTRFTNSDHPDFWRSDDPESPAYRGK